MMRKCSKLPLLILFGVVTAFLFVLRPSKASHGPDLRAETALLAFIAAFLVICEVIDRGPAFTGLRHFLYIVPVFAVLAGIGFDWLLRELQARSRALAAGAVIVLAALIVWNVTTLVRLHPYEYVFFNPLVGGIEGVARLYDMDYWVNVMNEAVEDLDAYIAELDENAALPAAVIPSRYAANVCRSKRSTALVCDGPPTGRLQTSSSRQRT